MAFAGFPTINYASQIRGINGNAGAQGRTPMALPRHKYTFIIELQLNPHAYPPTLPTTVGQYITNGRIYGQLKSIEYPKPRFEIETLRSYNRYRKIYRKMTYQPASIVWHDDSTSMIQSLIKEYINFYSETGNIGSNDLANDNLQFNLDTGDIVGAQVRNGMETRPSLGLKLRADFMRHFFESITIYDLGTEPTSVNLHTFHKPVIVEFDHDNLDWYSHDLISTRWAFEYEGYFFTTGNNVSNYLDTLNKVLGNTSATTTGTDITTTATTTITTAGTIST